MNKLTAMDNIWRLTLISFIFVEVIGVIVVVSSIASDEGIPTNLILLAYAPFLMFSGVIFVVARGIRRIVRKMYE